MPKQRKRPRRRTRRTQVVRCDMIDRADVQQPLNRGVGIRPTHHFQPLRPCAPFLHWKSSLLPCATDSTLSGRRRRRARSR